MNDYEELIDKALRERIEQLKDELEMNRRHWRHATLIVIGTILVYIYLLTDGASL